MVMVLDSLRSVYELEESVAGHIAPFRTLLFEVFPDSRIATERDSNVITAETTGHFLEVIMPFWPSIVHTHIAQLCHLFWRVFHQTEHFLFSPIGFLCGEVLVGVSVLIAPESSIVHDLKLEWLDVFWY